MKQEKQEKGIEGRGKEDPEMGVHGKKGRSRGDPGKIHRSRGMQCSGVSEENQKGDKDGETRMQG